MSTNRESWWQPGKLRSLWDMLEVEAKPFVAAVRALTMLKTLIRESINIERTGIDEPIGKEPAKDFRSQLKTLSVAAGAFQAPITQSEVKYFLKRLPQTTWRQAEPMIDTLFRVFNEEVSGAKLFALGTASASLYGRAATVFGEATVSAFPQAEHDLEEAGKCLALDRNTASVFHLMRAMELALRELCAKLGLTEVEKRWGFLLADLDNALDTLPKEDRQQWATTRTSLWHVKEVWRNDTMHPNEKYTDEEAREVLQAVRVFLRSLAVMVA